MQNGHSFTVYNASAGSGKTYSLVKEYLKILFKSERKEPFKHILAITFTNKAVAEMKDRIIETLKLFSNERILKDSNSMFEAICDELQIDASTLHLKSKKLLDTIIHNYAAFDVSTIDGFTHKIIRTFAHDLKIPLNFEVELDQDSLLSEAVDSLISKAGTEKKLTKVLVDFAIEKADDDKSWDVSYDFNKIAKLLVNENDIPFIETLKDKTIDDFNVLKSQLKTQIKQTENNIVEVAKGVLSLIDECGLEFNDFSSGYLPKHFKNLADSNYDLNFGAKWQTDLTENSPLYPKRITQNIAETIDEIQPQLVEAFNTTKKAVFQLKFLKSCYKNITPLSVLNAINKELQALKDDQNKMLISEFNSIISNEIKNQPTPFIYERIGEKFKHYFIDEFQDTSVLQWNNLMPLIDNSLSAEHGSALLVGDAKQAIYRWRGGRAEQFIGLFNKTNNPFQIEQHVETLPKNYRSFQEIVSFNNGFFKFLSSQVFSDKTHELLYQNSYQNTSIELNGYVNLTFLDIDKDDDRDELYTSKVLETINACLENNFSLGDICVLVRKKKEGVAIANYLSQEGIPIISSETLLIYNAPEVAFINDMLTLLIQPKNNDVKIRVLDYLAHKFGVDDKHAFFSNHIHLPTNQFFKSLEGFGVFINSHSLLQLSLYDLTETIVRCFNLVKQSNAYVQFYLDIVLDYTQKKGSDISGFLSYFEKKKDSLSIVSPTGQNAVQIMTIHKSKGLEFPVVIFPYADLDIYFEKEPKAWFPLEEDTFNGFSHTLLNYNKDFEHYGANGLNIFNVHESEKELDNINLLYVALTRAIEQLHIISKKDISTKNEVNNKRFSGLFINYLMHLGLWNDSNLSYSFGNPEKSSTDSLRKSALKELEFISSAKEDHNIRIVTSSGYLWDSHQEQAIEKGNLIHNMLSKIKTKDDVDFVVNDFIMSSMITKEQAGSLKKTIFEIIDHPKLTACFSSENTIYNERDIITKQGHVLRPDRVIINSNNEAIIVDYKTGQEDKSHVQQVITYQDVLEDMNFSVIKKILVYIDKTIHVKEV
ncbi:ATP-dependent helicase [Yeosuana aromativorans]|uniref:DNA 3'-5' helicase n=1 Tax=Yeosuana aromativorans TaxID=288019 RepID=A0A8J3BJX5_9FLAO|nr:UvrD-helicase domain-containing protein [Yeosuana aromativorans]GGK14435.1 ATP-dependent helicase [Yeosuana aromativorans]